MSQDLRSFYFHMSEKYKIEGRKIWIVRRDSRSFNLVLVKLSVQVLHANWCNVMMKVLKVHSWIWLLVFKKFDDLKQALCSVQHLAVLVFCLSNTTCCVIQLVLKNIFSSSLIMMLFILFILRIVVYQTLLTSPGPIPYVESFVL